MQLKVTVYSNLKVILLLLNKLILVLWDQNFLFCKIQSFTKADAFLV